MTSSNIRSCVVGSCHVMPRAPGPAPEDEAKKAPCFLMGQPARSNEAGLQGTVRSLCACRIFLAGYSQNCPWPTGSPQQQYAWMLWAKAYTWVPPFAQSLASGMCPKPMLDTLGNPPHSKRCLLNLDAADCSSMLMLLKLLYCCRMQMPGIYVHIEEDRYTHEHAHTCTYTWDLPVPSGGRVAGPSSCGTVSSPGAFDHGPTARPCL